MSRIHAQVQIDVTVYDMAELKAYALKRAIGAGMTEAEFNEGEHDEATDNLSYWLGWCFDAGTPEHCGFQIESSRVEEFA
ncbi:hypothetical protein [Bradyrhizobium elkanii]|uniref:hypothetical protein n=1 Tax=Bradyrhizobium elkanii TaxID=29448 RepID=UPI00272A5993|nr:hypothetical protein [Bradyrhizobium elkanii]WLA80310.1 hypothetical protein QNJ99_33735 [Bradyrhizobium elkanii]